jgi:hypothetical protein
MNEYIATTKEAQSEYKKNLSSLKAVNHNMKYECQILREQLANS